MKKNPYFPHVKSCGTNYHRLSKKISLRRELYVYIIYYMFSDMGNSMEDEC